MESFLDPVYDSLNTFAQSGSDFTQIFEDIKESYFEKSILNNFKINSLRKKIRVNSNKQMSINFPKKYSVQIKIKFNNDEELTQKSDHAKGDPENPMNEKEICNKRYSKIRRC